MFLFHSKKNQNVSPVPAFLSEMTIFCKQIKTHFYVLQYEQILTPQRADMSVAWAYHDG